MQNPVPSGIRSEMITMKKVNLFYFAVLRECSGKAGEVRETQADTYSDLYAELRNEYNFPLDASRVRVAVGENYADMSREVEAGADIAFIPPVAGG